MPILKQLLPLPHWLQCHLYIAQPYVLNCQMGHSETSGHTWPIRKWDFFRRLYIFIGTAHLSSCWQQTWAFYLSVFCFFFSFFFFRMAIWDHRNAKPLSPACRSPIVSDVNILLLIAPRLTSQLCSDAFIIFILFVWALFSWFVFKFFNSLLLSCAFVVTRPPSPLQALLILCVPMGGSSCPVDFK